MKISRIPSKIMIKLNNEKLEQVQNFKYLGVIINEQLNHELEIRSRIEQARNAFMKWKSCLTDKSLNHKLRLRTLKCYIWPILLYGVETWTLTTTTKKLQAFEMWLYRRMLRISWMDRINQIKSKQFI